MIDHADTYNTLNYLGKMMVGAGGIEPPTPRV
jgi:hypothetical protein